MKRENSVPLVVVIPIKDRTGKVIGEKEVASYAGLLSKAHEEGLAKVETRIVQIPGPDNGDTAVVTALVETQKGTFTGIGDASPRNVNARIAPHVIRMAETRAKARALRDAVNIGVVALEELGADGADEIADDAFAPSRTAASPVPGPNGRSNGSTNGRPAGKNGRDTAPSNGSGNGRAHGAANGSDPEATSAPARAKPAGNGNGTGHANGPSGATNVGPSNGSSPPNGGNAGAGAASHATSPAGTTVPPPDESSPDPVEPPMTENQRRYVFRLLAAAGLEGEAAREYLKGLFRVEDLRHAPRSLASALIDRIKGQVDAGQAVVLPKAPVTEGDAHGAPAGH